jgi:hypothetical protein
MINLIILNSQVVSQPQAVTVEVVQPAVNLRRRVLQNRPVLTGRRKHLLPFYAVFVLLRVQLFESF